MIRGMIYEREDTCPICHNERSLDIYDSHDKQIYFPLILDKNRLDKLYIHTLYYMKCNNCGREFKIDWSSSDHIPVPLLGDKIRYFLEDFNSYG